jgi:hypothetical protein
MHVRRMTRIALAAAAAALLAAGCGSASSSGSGSGGGSTPAAANALTGVVVIASDTHTGTRGARAPDTTVGLYLAPIHAGGPIAADPPQPIMQVQTARDGTFRFTGLTPGKRYFVFASGAKGYTIGHWAKPGDDVRLTVCPDCVMPL